MPESYNESIEGISGGVLRDDNICVLTSRVLYTLMHEVKKGVVQRLKREWRSRIVVE